MVLIPPLEGAVGQGSLEEFAVLTSRFTIIELDLIPGVKSDKTMKTQNVTQADVIPLCSVCVEINREQPGSVLVRTEKNEHM